MLMLDLPAVKPSVGHATGTLDDLIYRLINLVTVRTCMPLTVLTHAYDPGCLYTAQISIVIIVSGTGIVTIFSAFAVSAFRFRHSSTVLSAVKYDSAVLRRNILIRNNVILTLILTATWTPS